MHVPNPRPPGLTPTLPYIPKSQTLWVYKTKRGSYSVPVPKWIIKKVRENLCNDRVQIGCTEKIRIVSHVSVGLHEIRKNITRSH